MGESGVSRKRHGSHEVEKARLGVEYQLLGGEVVGIGGGVLMEREFSSEVR